MAANDEIRQRCNALYEPLLRFVRHETGIGVTYLSDADFTDYPALYFRERYAVMKALWSRRSFIDSYISLHPGIQKEDQETLRSWKSALFGDFLVAKKTDEDVLLVRNSTVLELKDARLSSLIRHVPCEVILDVLPFEGVLLAGGYPGFYPYTIGREIEGNLKRHIKSAKSAGTIHTQMSEDLARLDMTGDVLPGGIHCIHTIRVYPKGHSSSLYRMFRVSGEKTLDQLAHEILYAFELPLSDPYEYCMAPKKTPKAQIYRYHALPQDGARDTSVTLDETAPARGDSYVFTDLANGKSLQLHVEQLTAARKGDEIRQIHSAGSLTGDLTTAQE